MAPLFGLKEAEENVWYQCKLTLFDTLLTTLIMTRSPSLATIRGPGNLPFTVRMLLVLHNLVTLCSCTCTTYEYMIVTRDRCIS